MNTVDERIAVLRQSIAALYGYASAEQKRSAALIEYLRRVQCSWPVLHSALRQRKYREVLATIEALIANGTEMTAELIAENPLPPLEVLLGDAANG